MARPGSTCALIIISALLAPTLAHFPHHFYHWGHQWGPRADSSSSSSSSSSSESKEEETQQTKPACDAWVKQTLDSLHAQVSYLKKKLGTDCTPEDLSPLCPNNYYYIQGRCYKFSSEKETWDKARFNCTWEGGDLVALETPVEEKALDEFITNSKGYTNCKFYTLANDMEYKGFWLWGTGKDAAAVIYKNWAEGEPNDHGGQREACVEYYPKHGWNDVSCSTQMRYICERAPGYTEEAFKAINGNSTANATKNKDAKESSESSSSESSELHRRYGKSGKSHYYNKFGGPPPWWFNRGRHFHHNHRPWHHHRRGGYWHRHGPRGDYHFHGHGSHEKNYNGPTGNFIKHKSFGFHHGRIWKGGSSSSSSSSEEDKSKEKKEVTKSSDKKSSSGEKRYGGHHARKPWFYNKPWYPYYNRRYGSGESHEKKTEKERGPKTNPSGIVHGMLAHISHTSNLPPPIPPPLGFPFHRPFLPPLIFLLSNKESHRNETVAKPGNETTSVDLTSNSNETTANETTANQETNGTVANQTGTDNGNDNNPVTSAVNSGIDDNNDQVMGLSEGKLVQPKYRKHKGVYVYSYIPPHRPQRVFYPGLSPTMLERALKDQENSEVHLRYGYYYHHKRASSDSDGDSDSVDGTTTTATTTKTTTTTISTEGAMPEVSVGQKTTSTISSLPLSTDTTPTTQNSEPMRVK